MWRSVTAALVGVALIGAAQAQPSVEFAPREEQLESFPAGPGRDETFYACTACHNFRLVAAQGLPRTQWDESMTWMTRRHGMPDIQGAERDVILDYLSTHYPPRAPSRGGGFRNPFAPQ